jgi:hypothetical protein
MSARIVITAGVSVGNEYWIEQPVLTVGSDRQCEVFLPSTDVPAEAALVEFRGSGYRVHNRSAGELRVAGRPLASAQSADWPAGQEIELPGGVRVQLLIDGSPAPSPRPLEPLSIAEPLKTAVGDETRPAAAPAKTRSLGAVVQVAVIVVCVGLSAVVVIRGTHKEAPAGKPAEGPTLATLVEDGLKQNSESARRLTLRLQLAEAAHVRGNDKLAASRYERLKDYLAGELAGDPPGDPATAASPQKPAFESQLYEFVQQRAAELTELANPAK